MPLKRTELKRKTPIKRGTSRLPRVAKRKLPALRRATKWRREFLEAHPECRGLIRAFVPVSPDDWSVAMRWLRSRPCGFYTVDVHEIVKRGRGGSTTDEGNCIALCRNCHDFTEAHPAVATRLGLLASNPKWRSNGEG